MHIWVVQVRIRYKGIGSANYDCADSKSVFFGDAQSKSDYLNFVATGQKSSDPRHIELVSDFGECAWYNDRAWIIAQMNNNYLNGFFDRNLLP